MGLENVIVTWVDSAGVSKTKTLREIIGELTAGLIPQYIWDLEAPVKMELTDSVKGELAAQISAEYLEGKGKVTSIATRG